MSTIRKKIFIATLSGMTLMTMSACRWQYNRYNYSINKWKVLDEQFLKEEPDEIQFNSLPWQEQLKAQKKINIEDFEYRLIRLKGLLKGQRFFIHRHQDGRPGYLIVAPFINAQNEMDSKALVVNLGWIPSDMKPDFEKKKYSDEVIELSALIKRPEKVDYVNQYQREQIKKIEQQNKQIEESNKNNQQQQTTNKNDQNILEQSGFNSFIDLENLEKQFNCKIENNAYLEKFISRKAYDQLSISDSEQDLYPVCSSPQTFSKPYLTPDKHLSYCTFWGCCTTFGLITILRVARM